MFPLDHYNTLQTQWLNRKGERDWMEEREGEVRSHEQANQLEEQGRAT